MKRHLLLFVTLFVCLTSWSASPPSVVLTWRDNSNNESGFLIERAESAGTFAPLLTVPANVATYTDFAVMDGRGYSYRVQAYNAAGKSPWSNVATVQVGDGVVELPVHPDGLEAVASAPQDGELVNVSVRTKVVENEVTVITGFVVAKSAVTALIRVVGPTLGAPPFNVPGVCPDPKLIVFNEFQIIVAENDNWTDSPVADADVVNAAAKVGAFPLAPGSKDACYLIKNLPPGNYTVHARAVPGAGAGEVLCEVYNVPP